MNNLPITPARIAVAVGILITLLYPSASHDLRLVITGGIIGLYVLCYTIVEAIKTHKGVNTGTIENAVRNVVYAIREEDRTR